MTDMVHGHIIQITEGHRSKIRGDFRYQAQVSSGGGAIHGTIESRAPFMNAEGVKLAKGQIAHIR